MEKPHVWTFFYGSYMNFAVLKEVDLVPDRHEVARLGGFDIRNQPLAKPPERSPGQTDQVTRTGRPTAHRPIRSGPRAPKD